MLVDLKGVPSSQLIPIMTVMANSIGVTCSYCHEAEWESEAKPARSRATHDHVDAKTQRSALRWEGGCHLQHLSSWPRGNSRGAGHRRCGMEQAAFPGHDRCHVAGCRGSFHSLSPVDRRGGEDQQAQLFNQLQLRIRERYASAKTVGSDVVRGQTAYVVEAQPKEGALPERLYFDAVRGHLLRRERQTPTLVGPLPEQYDFDDYRMVDDVAVPFLLQWSRADYQVTHRLARVTQEAVP